jgi:transposase
MSNVLMSEAGRPETEVSSKATRRRFSAEYKRRILREIEKSTEKGAQGAILRREGLYSSHITKWREQSESGKLAGLSPKRRGPKRKVVDERDKRIAELEREVRKLTFKAERAEALVELQKRVSKLMGITLPNQDEEK